MKNNKEIIKEARVQWGLFVGSKSNQFDQEKVLIKILTKALQAKDKECNARLVMARENRKNKKYYKKLEMWRA